MTTKRRKKIPQNLYRSAQKPQAQKNIHVSYKDAYLLDKIVEVTTKVDYFAGNTENIYDQLRDLLVAYLSKKLVSFCKLEGKLDANHRVISGKYLVSSPVDPGFTIKCL